MNYHEPDYAKLETNVLSMNDPYIVNSLLRCGVDFPDIFSLIWGYSLAWNENFPLKLREIVVDIIQEEKKKRESLDHLERQLHSIAIDLLYFLYEHEVNDIWEKIITESVNFYK